MTACCMPVVLPTHRPWWQRVLQAVVPTRLHFAAKSTWQPQGAQPPESPSDGDLWFLSGLSDSMQADIGLPDAIRARSQALRERETLWQRW
jgi:hypothetical protein